MELKLRATLFGFAIRVAACSLVAGAAQARVETVRWTHPDPSQVQRFEAHLGSGAGVYTSVVELGKPAPDGSGVYTATVNVSDSSDVWVALRAVGLQGQLSDFSTARFRMAPPSNSAPSISYDFNRNAIGSVAAGWTDTAAAFSLNVDESLFSVVDTQPGGMLRTTSTLSNIHSHAIPGPTTNRNYRLRGRMSVSTSTAGVGVTVYSDFLRSASYYRLGRAPGGSFRIDVRPGTLSCTQVDSGLQPVDGRAYAFEIRVVSDTATNRVQAKVWDASGAEPTTMQMDCFDSRTDRPRAGTFGVWADGAGTKSWDDLVFESLPAPTGPLVPPTIAPPVIISVDPAGV